MQEISLTPQSKLEERLPYLLLPLLALAAILPLILHGCSCGHDIDFHLSGWLDAGRQLRHGTLFPHWAFSAAFNAGEPRFIFYPPISWLIGEILGLLYWPAASPAYLVLCLSLSGITFFRLARAYASPWAAMIAAALYMVNPYMLFTAYERSAYAELLAAAWFCLLLRALLREQLTTPALAIPLALLWLTNVPAAMIGSYTIAAVVLLRFIYGWITTRKPPIALIAPTLGGSALGLLLASIYLLPALWESRWVQTTLAIQPILLPQNNLLFAHTGDPEHDAILHTASLIAVALIAFTLAAFLTLGILRRRPSFARPAPAFVLPVLGALAALLVFLLTRPSTVLWTNLPDLSYLQFSWRLLLALGPIAALILALLLSRVRLNAPAAILAAALAGAILIPATMHWFRQACDPEDTPSGLRAAILTGHGYVPADEDTPNGASNDALHPGNSAWWLASDYNQLSDESGDDTSPPFTPDFLVNSPQKQFLILNLRDYPAWRVRINGQLVPAVEHRHRADGLIAVPIIAGLSAVDLSYATTGDITLGRLISLLALVRLFFLLDRPRRRADLSSAQQ